MTKNRRSHLLPPLETMFLIRDTLNNPKVVKMLARRKLRVDKRELQMLYRDVIEAEAQRLGLVVRKPSKRKKKR